MFYLHCTKKLLDRTKPEIAVPGQSDTALGNWYATVLFWKPQVALLVSERTLLPVLMPLAPAATLTRRFPAQLGLVLKEHGAPSEFIAQEVWRMDKVLYAKTVNRSVVGVNRRPIGTPYRRAKGTPFVLRGSVDAGRRFRAAGGVGRA